MSESAIVNSVVDSDSINDLQKMGLLRSNIEVPMDRGSPLTYGLVSDHGKNIAAEVYDTRSILQQRYREFARRQGFYLRVATSSWRKTAREGHAKYVCKRLKGQQPLVPGTVEECPFTILVYGIRDQWKITRMVLGHNHYLHAGFQEDTFVEGELSADSSRQRQRDVPYSMMRGMLEREMLPAYSGTWATVTGKAILDFLKSNRITTNRQMASKLKRDLLESLRDDVLESYQKLEAYLSMITGANSKSSYGFEKREDGVFK